MSWELDLLVSQRAAICEGLPRAEPGLPFKPCFERIAIGCLAPLGVRELEMPATRERAGNALRAARAWR